MQTNIFDGQQRDEFMKRIIDGEHLDCPTCRRYAQRYERKLHSVVAAQLIQLYKMGGAAKWVHTSELIPGGQSGSGDFSKAKYWKLIEAREVGNDEDKKASGFWKLTDLGVSFIIGKETIQQTAVIFDDRVLKFEGPQVTIRDALGTKFSYEEMIAA